jgi:adenosylcobinamide-phosphate synthase
MPCVHVTANLLIATGALGIEAAFGYSETLGRALGHPVIWLGAVIGWFDRRTNRPTDPEHVRRNAGVLALGCVVTASTAGAALLQFALQSRLPWPAAIGVLAMLTSTLLAQCSLHAHVTAVAEALERDSLDAARGAVSHIVGRNPRHLDSAGVARAAIESLAENFSDAVVAPAFWCALFGLPGIVFYKTVNTADSMIGHKTPRHAAFGWAAARLDDIVNLPASRLSALWLVLAACSRRDAHAGAAIRAVWRDAAKHRSPNAGWPEAAIAGALELRLAGPRVYGETQVDDGWMGDGRPSATSADIRRALSLYRVACALQLGIAAALAACIMLIGRG